MNSMVIILLYRVTVATVLIVKRGLCICSDDNEMGIMYI